MSPSRFASPGSDADESTVIAYARLLDHADLPEDARATAPVPSPNTDDVITRELEDFSGQIWDWAERFPGLGDTLSEYIDRVERGEAETSSSDDDGPVAGMSFGDDSMPDVPGSSGETGPGMDEPGMDGPGMDGPGMDAPGRGAPGRSQRSSGQRGGRRGGGRPGMTGDFPGSRHDDAASELEDDEGRYELRNAVNLARDLARRMRQSA